MTDAGQSYFKKEPEKNWAEKVVDFVTGGVTGVQPVEEIRGREDKLQEQIKRGTGAIPGKQSSLLDTMLGFLSPSSAYGGEIPKPAEEHDPLVALEKMRRDEEIKAKIDEE
jgi:hypothetical protein